MESELAFNEAEVVVPEATATGPGKHPEPPTQDQIRLEAYRIWQRRVDMHIEGTAHTDWVEAELILWVQYRLATEDEGPVPTVNE